MQPNLRHERLDDRLRSIPGSALNAIITQIAAIDEFKGWWRGRGLPTPVLRKHVRPTVAVSASASTQIDGRNTAAGRGRAFGRGRPVGDAQASAARAAYAAVLRAVFDDSSGLRFGQDLILQLHERLLRNSPVTPSRRGRYKTVADTTSDYMHRKMESPALRAADPDLTPQLMATATAWTVDRLAGREFHPLLVIANFVLEFLAIRPFVDGNGRLSRILTTLLLLQCGYTHIRYVSLERVIAHRWTDYYLGLRRAQANANLPSPDITPWLHAFLEVLHVQVEQLWQRLATHREDARLSRNQLAVLGLLEHNEELTNRLVCHALDLPKDTAKQVLTRLARLDLVRRMGAGRAVRYRKIALQAGDAAAR